jgi:hypothetical protein
MLKSALVTSAALFIFATSARAGTVNFASSSLIGSPVSSTFDISTNLVGGTVVAAYITANFQDDLTDHYFYTTQYVGGNDFNWVYVDPAETAKLTVGTQTFQGSSPYSYIRYFARTENGNDFFEVIDGYGGDFSIIAALDQSAVDALNATGMLSFQVSSLLGNFRFVDITLRYDLAPALVATPIPAALPLFATGLAGLGLIGWRRKRRAAALAAN